MYSRNRFLIDNRVQGALVSRVLIYWSFVLVYAFLSMTAYKLFQKPDISVIELLSRTLAESWLWLPGAILLIPLVIFDVVRLSNQFTGPVYRLRKHLSDFLDDFNCRPINFRDEDYWQDLACAINDQQTYIKGLQDQLAEKEALLESLQASDTEVGVAAVTNANAGATTDAHTVPTEITSPPVSA